MPREPGIFWWVVWNRECGFPRFDPSSLQRFRSSGCSSGTTEQSLFLVVVATYF
jgi:hypothetical protein